MRIWAKQAIQVPGKVLLCCEQGSTTIPRLAATPAPATQVNQHPQGEHHNQGTLLCLTQPHLAPATICWQLVAPVLLSLVVVTHLQVSTLQRGMELLLLCCCTERSVLGCK